MIAIIMVYGQDDEFIENVDCVVSEFPNCVRICRDGHEDRWVYVEGVGTTGRPKISVSVVP